MVSPLKASEVVGRNAPTIPGEVIAVFNQLIQEMWDGCRAVITLGDATVRIIASYPAEQQPGYNDLVRNRWLKVARPYRDAGWNVEFVPSPDRVNAPGDACFIFS